jgi:hypothetical protein
MSANLRRILSVAFALIVATAFLQPFQGGAAPRSNRKSRITGTWRVQMTPKNCQTGAPMPPFSFLVSFARGGTFTEVMNAPAFSPGQRTTGLGVWSRVNWNTYKSVSEAFLLFDSPTTPGFRRGAQRLTWNIEVDDDQIAIESAGQFLDDVGNVIAASCATGIGTRFEGGDDED